MKLREAFLFESALQAEDKVESMEQAYEEIALLHEMFDDRDVGVLIGKRGRRLDINDLREIKRRFSSIVRSNPIIDENEVNRGRDGDEKLRVLARKSGHWAEVAGLGILTAVFGGLSALTVGVPIASVLSGSAAGLSALGIKHQFTLISHLNSLSRLLNVVDSFEDLKPKYRRSGVKRFFDFIMRKTPEDIKKDAERKIKKSSDKAQRKMEKALKGFPKEIPYWENGEERYYKTAQLFDI